MTDVFRSLDYTPMFAGGDIPALVTLTAPHDWESVFPTPESFALKRTAFFQEFERAWGTKMVCVWKLEFQDRRLCREKGCHDPRAPHLHLLMTPPRGVSRGRGIRKGLHFKEWLSIVWAQVVGVSDPSGFADHVKAGTNVDWREGQRYSDPKRIAVYFDKHSGYHEKDYQNEWPELWKKVVAAGGAGTNVWGYTRTLKKITETVELSRQMGASTRPRPARRVDPLGGFDEPSYARHAMPSAVELAGMITSKPIMSGQAIPQNSSKIALPPILGRPPNGYAGGSHSSSGNPSGSWIRAKLPYSVAFHSSRRSTAMPEASSFATNASRSVTRRLSMKDCSAEK